MRFLSSFRVFGVVARPRSAGFAKLLLMVVVAAAGSMGLGALGLLRDGATPPATAFPPSDTTYHYGPTVKNGSASPGTNYVDQITIAVTPGYSYRLRLVNGNPGGTNRVTSAVTKWNGKQILGTSDFTSSTAEATLLLSAMPTDTLQITVVGPAGSFVTASVFSIPDPMFTVYGDSTYVVPAGVTTKVYERNFTKPATAAAPFRLFVTNGNATGGLRVSGDSIKVNTTTVATPSDLALAVGSFSKTVTLVAGTNSLRIKVKSPNTAGGRFITLRVMATDTTAPTLVVNTPADSTYTNQTSITASGTIADQTLTKVTVNGGQATVTGNTSWTATVPLPTEGWQSLTYVATDAAGKSTTKVRYIYRDTQTPALTVTTPVDQSATKNASVTVAGTVVDATPVTVNTNGTPLTVTGTTFSGSVALAYGPNTLVTTATDLAGNATSVVRTVTRDTLPPVLTVTTPLEGATVPTDSVVVAGTVTDATATTVAANGINLPVSSGNFTGKVPLVVGPNVISVVATDAATNTATVVRNVTRGSGLPPDPVTVASTLNRVEVSTIGAATDFLYTGGSPIQTGVAPGTIAPIRAAVVRGRVLDRQLQPLGGVAVKVLGHPELGQTLSRADGNYDLAVNGGDHLVFDYTRSGYFPVQRRSRIRWQDFTRLDDIIMVAPDTAVTAVDLTAGSPGVARGSAVTDADGTRRATLVFEPGTTATLVRPDSTTQALTTIHVRATEYTVGDSGHRAMPAELPPTSGYTYAVEMSVDESQAVPGSTVQFSKPVPLYVENFLELPVGLPMPLGRYDPAKGNWIPERNGVVLKVISIDGTGRAQLDVTGDGVADPVSVLNTLGITDYEQQQLAGTYPSGTDLWRALIRVPAAHDVNLPIVQVGSAPTDGRVRAGCSSREGDPLRCQLQAQTAFQSAGLVGSPFTLNYASDRTQGNAADRKLDITLTGATLPPFLARVELEVAVAGKRFTGSFAPSANLTYTFNWDGLDLYNRLVQGTQPATVLIGYVFPVFYARPAPGDTSFALPCLPLPGGPSCALSASPQAIPRAQQVEVQAIQTSLGTLDASALAMGGFTFDVHHVYDPVGQMLFQGDGTRRQAAALPPQARAIAGNGLPPTFLNDGIPALAEDLGTVDVAAGPDGSIYFTDFRNHPHLRKIAPDGILSTIIGGLGGGSTGDGGPASGAQISAPTGLAIGPDGSIYILESPASKVRRVAPNGIITTVVGTGVNGFSGDGGPATAAQLNAAQGIAVGPDGSLYIADAGNHRIRLVGTDGIIHTLAGTGTECGNPFFHPTDADFNAACGHGIPATQAGFKNPEGVAVGPDGSVYTAESGSQRVRRITPDGIVRTVAGNPGQLTLGDGGPVGLASFAGVKAIAVGADGALYVSQAIVDPRNFGCRIRRVEVSGIVNTYAGGAVCVFTGTTGIAQATGQDEVSSMTLSPDGGLHYISWARIYKITGFLPQFSNGQTAIASEDGGQLYLFSAAGRHLLTLDAVTQDTIYQFGYNANRQLISITDRDGRVTQVVRNASGVPTSVVMPNGQSTAVQLDANGQLQSLTGPDGLPIRFGIAANGLLAGAVNQAGDSVARYTYDAQGKVIGAKNSLGGTTTFNEVVSGLNTTLTLQPPTGQALTFTRTPQPTGAEALNALFAGGLQVSSTLEQDGDVVTTAPDGTITTIVRSSDPRFGTQPSLGEGSIRLPSGLTRTTRLRRGAVLTDPIDPLSISQQIDSVIVNGRANTIVQNKAANTVVATSAGGRTSISQLDAAGRVTGVAVSGLPALTQSYDALGRLFQTKVGGRTQTLGFDGRDRVNTVTDPLGLVHGFEYDSAGRVTKRTFPDGRFVQLGYDSIGNLRFVTPPSKPVHELRYTPEGQVTRYAAPTAGGSTPIQQFAYDTAGRLKQVTRPDSTVVDISYAPTSLSQTMTLPGGEVLQITRDPVTGNLTGSTLTNGASLAHSYDGALQTGATWSGPVSGSVTQTFDTDFRVFTQSVNGGNTITRGYDNDGLLTTAGALSLTRSPQTGFLTGTTLGGVTTFHGYTPGPEVDTTHATFGATTLYASKFLRDSLGRILTKRETIGGVTSLYTFAYDSAGRLETVTKDGNAAESYDYDPNGNRLQATNSSGTHMATVDAQDRLMTYGAASYSYTTNGELRRKVAGTDTTFYTYDALGNLRSVRQPDGTLIEYVVDGEGRRVGKKVNGVLQHQWLWSGQLAVVAELDGAGALISRFVYGDRVNVPEYMIRGGGTYRIVADERGSVRLVVDVATGTIAQRMDYDSFGRVLLDTNAGFQPFGFAGGLNDNGSALVRFGRRDYDPSAGRWTAKDPALFAPGDGNLYQYSGADPINSVDPSGLCDNCTLIGQAAAVVGLGTLATNVMFGRPPTENVFRNTTMVLLAGFLVAEVFPAAIAGGADAVTWVLGATGPLTVWFRYGPSYSKYYDLHSIAIRFGSNPHYQRLIGSDFLRGVNNFIHNLRIPLSGWQFVDPGHVHLWWGF